MALGRRSITDISVLAATTKLEGHLYWNDIPFNTAAYCIYKSIIRANNPGITYLNYSPNPNPLTNDCATDINDLAQLSLHWLQSDCGEPNNFCSGADLNHIDGVDMYDFTEFAMYWMEGVE